MNRDWPGEEGEKEHSGQGKGCVPLAGQNGAYRGRKQMHGVEQGTDGWQGVNQVHVSLGMRFEIVDFLLRYIGAMEVLSGADQRAYYVSKLVSFTWTILENPAAALKGRGNSPPLENEKTESQRRYTTQPKSPI